MKISKGFVLILLLLLSAASVSPQTKGVGKNAPNDLVAELYRQHNAKHSPFFQTKSRALVYKYFVKDLADMIWKDAVQSKGEVGKLDGDPLYDAQDMDIKYFAIGKPTVDGAKAQVHVTFENFGEKKDFVFSLVKGVSGWRIDNIEYGEGRSLRGYLKG